VRNSRRMLMTVVGSGDMPTAFSAAPNSLTIKTMAGIRLDEKY